MSIVLYIGVGLLGLIVLYGVYFLATRACASTNELNAGQQNTRRRKKKRRKKAERDGAVLHDSERSMLLDNLSRAADISAETVSDDALLSTFHDVLSEGMLLKLYTARGSKDVKVWLEGHILKYYAWRSLTKKRYKLNLHDVLFVESGKKTSNFERPHADLVSEDMCFSLVTGRSTLDLATTSKIERDAMVQGMEMFLADLKLQTAEAGDGDGDVDADPATTGAAAKTAGDKKQPALSRKGSGESKRGSPRQSPGRQVSRGSSGGLGGDTTTTTESSVDNVDDSDALGQPSLAIGATADDATANGEEQFV